MTAVIPLPCVSGSLSVHTLASRLESDFPDGAIFRGLTRIKASWGTDFGEPQLAMIVELGDLEPTRLQVPAEMQARQPGLGCPKHVRDESTLAKRMGTLTGGRSSQPLSSDPSASCLDEKEQTRRGQPPVRAVSTATEQSQPQPLGQPVNEGTVLAITSAILAAVESQRATGIQPIPPNSLSLDDSARFIGVERKTIEYLISNRTLPYVQVGEQRVRACLVKDLVDFNDRRRMGTAAEMLSAKSKSKRRRTN